MNFSEELRKTERRASDYALENRHPKILAETFLLALLDDTDAVKVLTMLKIDIAPLRKDLEDYLAKKNNPKVYKGTSPQLSDDCKAIYHWDMLGSMWGASMKPGTPTNGAHMLVALMNAHGKPAANMMVNHGITMLGLTQAIQHGSVPAPKATETTEKDDDDKPDLKAFLINLNDLAKEGKIDPVIGRDAEIERVIQTLCRRRKNNPLLVGEPGVGKTAIAEGLAKRIVDGDVPDVLKGFTVRSLDIGAVMAGTKYRGDFEERMKQVMKKMSGDNEILFIDEIHTIIGAGAASGGTLDVSNLLKPALAKGNLKCIGATTLDEARKIFSKDAALERRFQKIEVNEPSVAETSEILKGLKSRFEEHHGIRYTDDSLKAAAELSAKHINDRFLPDKAIDLIDEAGAAEQIKPKAARKSEITRAEIEMTVAKIARIPPASVSTDDRAKLQHLDRDLKNVVFGQDPAIEAVASAIKMARSGLGRADKPIGSFLFSGPTGVGKTEVAKQLARTLGIDLIRFDMSEYMESHAVSRLIGAPPGYVGFNQGGLLTEAVNKKPQAVLLLDEIEKAHPDIFNILLQVMDHGTLTDNNGRKADFRNVIIIMTTNAGAETMNKATIGFTNAREQGDEMADIKKLFTPEFRNRLDATVSFKALDQKIIRQVADKFFAQLEAQLDEKKVQNVFTERLRDTFARLGFDPLMGARPMQRLIQDKIRKVLADELLFGRLADGGRVKVDYDPEEKEEEKKLKLLFNDESGIPGGPPAAPPPPAAPAAPPALQPA